MNRVCMVVILLLAAGCARSDWIQGTLVTVDVTGVWSGEPAGNSAPVRMELTLQQAGSVVRGTVTLKGAQNSPPVENAPIEGTINGDVVRLSNVLFYNSFEIVVSRDQMSGSFFGRSGRMTVDLVRTR